MPFPGVFPFTETRRRSQWLDEKWYCDAEGDIWVIVCNDCLQRRAAAKARAAPPPATSASSSVQPPVQPQAPTSPATIIMYRSLVMPGPWRFWYG